MNAFQIWIQHMGRLWFSLAEAKTEKTPLAPTRFYLVFRYN